MPEPDPRHLGAATAQRDSLAWRSLGAYRRWRQAEALVVAGASRAELSEPLKQAHAVAFRSGARPLLEELDLLAGRVRLDFASPDVESADTNLGLEEILGLTPREAEVLALVARGYTPPDRRDPLLGVKTASVHVSHNLHKFGAPNRHEAAATARRVASRRHVARALNPTLDNPQANQSAQRMRDPRRRWASRPPRDIETHP